MSTIDEHTLLAAEVVLGSVLGHPDHPDILRVFDVLPGDAFEDHRHPLLCRALESHVQRHAALPKLERLVAELGGLSLL